MEKRSDFQLVLLFGSAKLPRRPHASSGVRPLVLPKPLTVNETLFTLPTLVGSLSGVEPVVDLQFLGSGVAFPADAANEWPVVNVSLIMCVQVGVDLKCLSADGTGVGPLPRVLHLMEFEGGSSVETSAAKRAEEGPLARMDALVNLYVALVDEPFAAVRAWVSLLLHVGFHMFLQLLLDVELNAAAAAEEEL